MPKVFVFIDWFLPGTNSGGPVRSISNLIEALPEAQFYVFTRNHDYCLKESYKNIQFNSWLQYSPNCKVYYSSNDQLHKEQIRTELRNIGPDVLYINGIYSKVFSRWPLHLGKKLGIPMIVAPRGMLSPHSLGIKKLKKKAFLTWMKCTRSYNQVIFHATSADEVGDINRIISKYKSIEFIPNLPKLNEQKFPVNIEKEIGNLRLVFIGRIAKEKGLLEGLTALINQTGNIELNIYGTCYDKTYWQSCLKVINRLPKNVFVNYYGECPSEDVKLHLQKAHALLMPSHGENFGHAIVESLAQGRPVIISKNTPWKDLEQQKAGYDIENLGLRHVIEIFVNLKASDYQIYSLGAFYFYKRNILNSLENQLKKYNKLFSNKC